MLYSRKGVLFFVTVIRPESGVSKKDLIVQQNVQESRILLHEYQERWEGFNQRCMNFIDLRMESLCKFLSL